jgi:hypothetical protein
MTPREAQRAEVSSNYQVFAAALPDLVASSEGKFAVLHHRELIGVFDSFATALAYCRETFLDGLYSIQEITLEPLDLKWFDDAPDPSPVRSSHWASD